MGVEEFIKMCEEDIELLKADKKEVYYSVSIKALNKAIEDKKNAITIVKKQYDIG